MKEKKCNFYYKDKASSYFNYIPRAKSLDEAKKYIDALKIVCPNNKYTIFSYDEMTAQIEQENKKIEDEKRIKLNEIKVKIENIINNLHPKSYDLEKILKLDAIRSLKVEKDNIKNPSFTYDAIISNLELTINKLDFNCKLDKDKKYYVSSEQTISYTDTYDDDYENHCHEYIYTGKFCNLKELQKFYSEKYLSSSSMRVFDVSSDKVKEIFPKVKVQISLSITDSSNE